MIILYHIHNFTSSKEEWINVECYNRTDCNGLDNIQRMKKFCVEKFDLSQFFGNNYIGWQLSVNHFYSIVEVIQEEFFVLSLFLLEKKEQMNIFVKIKIL